MVEASASRHAGGDAMDDGAVSVGFVEMPGDIGEGRGQPSRARIVAVLGSVLLVAALGSSVLTMRRFAGGENYSLHGSLDAAALSVFPAEENASWPRPLELTEDPRYKYEWEYKIFKRDEIAENMLHSDCDGRTATGAGVPPEFGGLWWMDGNPAPETVASFAHADWEWGPEACNKATLSTVTAEERATNTLVDPFGDRVPCQGRMLVAFWEDRIWAMPDTFVGRAYEQIGTAANSHMEFVCGGHDRNYLTICKLGASTGPAAKAALMKLADSIKGAYASGFNLLFRFTMVKVNPDYWIRYSLDGKFPYFLKRIVGCNGAKVQPHYSLYLSGGQAEPARSKDLFGHGGDTRAHVAKVNGLQFVRWKKAPSPEGSGFFCSRFTGQGCAGSRHRCLGTGGTCATIDEGFGKSQSTCLCGEGQCEEGGTCYPDDRKCWRDTGGTCLVMGCSAWRHAECTAGKCLCPVGFCEDGKGGCNLQPERSRDTGGTCEWLDCATSRQATCVSGKCICQGGSHAENGKCVY